MTLVWIPALTKTNMHLEELIQACGDKFRSLTLHTDYSRIREFHWQAKANMKKINGTKAGWGHSPEEAVRNLLINLKII